MEIEEKVFQRLSRQQPENKGPLRIGYSVTLAIDPAVYSVVFYKIQLLTDSYLREKYPQSGGLTFKAGAKNRGLKEIHLTVYGDISETAILHFLEHEILSGMNGKVLYYNLESVYRESQPNGQPKS